MILPNQTTAYHFLENIPDYANAIVILENKKIMVGLAVPPNSYPTPYLPNGKYTLQIFPDSTCFFGYNAKFIQ